MWDSFCGSLRGLLATEARFLLLALLWLVVPAGAAQGASSRASSPPPSQAHPASQAEALSTDAAPAPAVATAFAQAVRRARASTLLGPGRVTLTPGLELVLPKDTEFIPGAAAHGLLEAMGQSPGPELLGLIQPHGQGDWMVSVRYETVGRVAVPADPVWPEDRLLQQLQDRLRQANDVAPGATPVVTGWAQRPAYDAERHRLVWSVRLQRPSRASIAPPSADTANEEWVNYNVHALGRHGVLSLGLTTPAATLARDKRLAHVLLAGVDYLPGERVQDSQPEDPVAAMSLEAFIVPEARPADGLTTAWPAKLLVAACAGLAYALWRLRRAPRASHRRTPRPHTAPTGTATAGR